MSWLSQIHFRINLSNSMKKKKLVENFNRITFNLKIKLGRAIIFIILSIPIMNIVCLPHLIRSSLLLLYLDHLWHLIREFFGGNDLIYFIVTGIFLFLSTILLSTFFSFLPSVVLIFFSLFSTNFFFIFILSILFLFFYCNSWRLVWTFYLRSKVKYLYSPPQSYKNF